MTLTDLTTIANSYTDETFSSTVTLSFANEAIATINTELKTTLPFMTASTAYTALTESWVRVLLVPYIAYSIKMNDGSLNEADRFMSKFMLSLNRLKKDKNTEIPVSYLGDSSKALKTWVTATEGEYTACPVDFRLDLGNISESIKNVLKTGHPAARYNEITVARGYDLNKKEYNYAKIGAGRSIEIQAYRGL